MPQLLAVLRIWFSGQLSKQTPSKSPNAESRGQLEGLPFLLSVPQAHFNDLSSDLSSSKELLLNSYFAFCLFQGRLIIQINKIEQLNNDDAALVTSQSPGLSRLSRQPPGMKYSHLEHRHPTLASEGPWMCRRGGFRGQP